MRLFSIPIQFDWDKGNLDKNKIKHNVTAQEAEEIFSNEPLIIHEDELHSTRELRYNALGKTSTNRRLHATFTVRSKKVRIISIRDMDRREGSIYESAEKDS
jgi:hypothetical protein